MIGGPSAADLEVEVGAAWAGGDDVALVADGADDLAGVDGVADPDAAGGEVGVPGGDLAAAGEAEDEKVAVADPGAAADGEGGAGCRWW